MTLGFEGSIKVDWRMTALTAVLYHAIAPSESDFERGLDVITHPEKFASHIQYLDRHYDIIDLDTMLRGKMPRRPLLITFDDFYKSVMTAAREVLKPKEIPSVFFVNPSLVRHDAIGLDNLLAFCVNRFGLASVCEVAGVAKGSLSGVGDLIADVASTYSSARRGELSSDLMSAFGPGPEDLGARSAVIEPSDLRECAALGMEIGNHTATHVHGRSLGFEELKSEISESREKLEALAGSPIRAFSLPYGSEKDLTAPVLKAVRESGHEATFLVHARSNYFRPAPDIWYRTSLHNEAASEFPMKLTVMPLLRSARSRLL
jgi:peptidoglycan/xylan/chitin deacetylase (PgdA/CDA1 family)